MIFAVGVLAGGAGFTLFKLSFNDQPAAQLAATTPIETTASADKPRGPVTELPNFSLPNREGVTQSIRSWPNKSLIVNFWATWCAPCRKEIPFLNQISKKEAAAGFEVVGIAIDYRDAVLPFAKEIGIDYPLLIGEEQGLAAADAFGVPSPGLPFTVFTDNKGRIVTLLMGELTPAKADVILGAVKDVNSGKSTPEAARIAIAGKVSKLPVSSP